MSAREHRDIAIQAFASVMERLAFVFAEPCAGTPPPPPVSPALLVSIGFGGVLAGTIDLAVSRALCVEIAANMLGVDSSDERARERAEDAIREVLNVTCGQILTDLAGERPMFTLTMPRTRELSPELTSELAHDSGTSAFKIDSETVWLRFRLEGAQ